MKILITRPTRAAAGVLLSLLVIASCDDNLRTVVPSPKPIMNRLVNGQVEAYSFDGTEGDPINLQIAHNWIKNYTKQNNGDITGCYFSRKSLLRMLTKPGCKGIRFYYCKNAFGNRLLLASGADQNGDDEQNQFKVKGIPSKNDLFERESSEGLTGMETDSISTVIATKWKAYYLNSNPNGMIAHFFGYEIINQILSESGCVGLRGFYSLDETATQKLLLVGVDNKGRSILPGSSTGERVTDSGFISDNSFPCPTFCSSL